MAYKQKNSRDEEYTLYRMQIQWQKDNKQVRYFFAKGTPKRGTPCDLPDGYEVVENEKTGLLFARKKK